MAQSPAEHVMEHVGDEPGHWTFFTHIIDGGFQVPLLNLREYGIPFTLTKFMLLEVLVAGLIIAIFVPLARKASKMTVPTGPWWNLFESFLTFIRDEIARPTLSGGDDHHDEPGEGHGEQHGTHAREKVDYADKYVPFLWTVFLFVLFCNLLGMIPFLGSPTASIWVTGALAVCSLLVMHGAAIARMGLVPYLKSLWLPVDIPFGMGYVLKPMIWIIEMLGTVIKSGVLAVRLFANMFAGHMVLGMILYFIVLAANGGWLLFTGVTVASVFGVVALSLLELFVAFLQAYIFTFLTALFMGMALHPQH